MTGKELLELVLVAVECHYTAGEYGPFVCVVPEPLIPLLDSDYHTIPYLLMVRERLLLVGPVIAVEPSLVPVVEIRPVVERTLHDPEVELVRTLLISDPTTRGLYRGLNEREPVGWQIFADCLEEAGCPVVARRVRDQHPC